MKVTMIITTYNWPEALRLTLKSIINQKFKPFEVIIADDGSDKRTEEMVKKTLTNSSLRWAHIWHKDKGVRQSRIKNLAVRYSSGKYLVFIDQDTVLHPLFLKDHVENSENGLLLQGKRVLLNKKLTKKLIDKGYIKELSFFSKGINHLYHEKPRWWDRDRLDNELKRTVEEKRRKAIIGYSKLNDEGVILNASRVF